MHKPPLQTLDKRRTRTYARRRRNRSMAAGASLGLLVVLIATVALGVGHVVASHQPSPPTTPRSVAVAAAAEPTAPPDPADPTLDASATTDASGTPVSAEPSGTITVAAVGDMIFDRAVKDLIASSGSSAPFAGVTQYLSSADITVGNVESTLSNVGSVDASKDATFRGDVRAVDGLSTAGFDFVSIANNHTLDYGAKSLLDEISRLDAAGIGHAGAGKNRDAAWAPAVAERNGASVAYLAFSHIVPYGWMATTNSPGLASGRWDMARVQRTIRSAKKTHDYVIVTFHWGVEYQDKANAEQIANAHKAIDAGADLVASSHPHVIQGIESYKGKLIAYSLGDFVFDHFSKKTGEAFILTARLSPDGATEATITPVYLDKNGSPAVVTGAEATSILGRLKALSAPLHGDVAIDGDVARIVP